jgi:cysteine desulfurase
LARRSVDESVGRLAKLRDRLQKALQNGVGAELTLNGALNDRLPTTLSVNFPGVSGSQLLARTPELCASTGAACHSGTTPSSPTLDALGVPPNVARGTVRLSVGWDTSEEEIDCAADLLLAAWEALHP